MGFGNLKTYIAATVEATYYNDNLMQKNHCMGVLVLFVAFTLPCVYAHHDV